MFHSALGIRDPAVVPRTWKPVWNALIFYLDSMHLYSQSSGHRGELRWERAVRIRTIQKPDNFFLLHVSQDFRGNVKRTFPGHANMLKALYPVVVVVCCCEHTFQFDFSELVSSRRTDERLESKHESRLENLKILRCHHHVRCFVNVCPLRPVDSAFARSCHRGPPAKQRRRRPSPTAERRSAEKATRHFAVEMNGTENFPTLGTGGIFSLFYVLRWVSVNSRTRSDNVGRLQETTLVTSDERFSRTSSGVLINQENTKSTRDDHFQES